MDRQRVTFRIPAAPWLGPCFNEIYRTRVQQEKKRRGRGFSIVITTDLETAKEIEDDLASRYQDRMHYDQELYNELFAAGVAAENIREAVNSVAPGTYAQTRIVERRKTRR